MLIVVVQARSSNSERSERDAASTRIRVVATRFIAWQTAYSSVQLQIIGDWPEPSVLLARVEM